MWSTCSHVLTGLKLGNGIVERSHRTIKRMVARSSRSVADCVFWYNATSSAHECSPFEAVLGVKPRLPGVRTERLEVERSHACERTKAPQCLDRGVDMNPFAVGDQVFLRPPGGRCDAIWTGPHRVTAVKSATTVVHA